MYNFENVIIQGHPASRYIMSYIRAGGKLRNSIDCSLFKEWLIHLKLTPDDIRVILNLLDGRLELEEDARLFLKNL